MFLVFPEYPNFLYFSWIILPQSVTAFLLMGVWLWNLVVISNLLQWVCKSGVIVLLSSKFDLSKVGLANKVLQSELVLARLESFTIHLVAGQNKGKDSTNRDVK